PVQADDASAPAPSSGPVLVIGGPHSPPAVADDDSAAGGGSLLLRFPPDPLPNPVAVRPTPRGPPGGPRAAPDPHPGNRLGGFSLDGRLTHWLETDPQHPDDRSYSVGASYRLDSWTLGIDWTRGNYDESFLDIGDRNDSDVYAFTTSYSVRPGVRINGLLEYSDGKSGQAGADSGALAGGIGIPINF